MPTGGLARTVTLATAAAGPGTIAVVLTLLFPLTGSFQRREALVLTLDARAGVPHCGVSLLETYGQLDIVDELPRVFGEWERWAAEMLDEQLAYAILAYFRSGHDNWSWVSALGAVLDAATLLLSAIEGDKATGHARLMYTTGCHSVEDLGRYFGLNDASGPGVERDEFEEALQRLASVGYRILPVEAAWERFQASRSVYAGPLNAMARYWATPPAHWIGGRSALHHS